MTIKCLFVILLTIDGILSAVISNGVGSDFCKQQRMCEYNSNWDRSVIADVKKANCFCSEDCVIYGDCCIDSIHNTSRPNPDFTCTKEGLLHNYYLKVKCPYDADAEMKRLCENPTFNDPFLYIPATSLFSNITYRNMYCGVCNNENAEVLKLWLPVLSCTAYDGSSLLLDVTYLRSHLKYNLNYGSWDYDVEDNLMKGYRNGINCQTEFSIPPKSISKRVKLCKENTAWCHAAWTDDLINSKCLSYTAYVYTPGGYAFKNLYCAKCNYVNIDELICQVPRTIYSNNDVYLTTLLKDLYSRGDHVTCTVTNYYSKNRISSQCGTGLMPFTVGSETICVEIPEFPFNDYGINNIAVPREVCSLEFIIPVVSKNRLSKRHCKLGYAYDPFVGHCRPLFLEYAEVSTPSPTTDDSYEEITDEYSSDDIKDEVNAQERSSRIKKLQ